MALTQEDLKSTLWDAANTLRGSAVDRTDWKGYILPLLNKGKRGGVRVIYYHRNAQGRIYLITVYSKNVKDDLTDSERNAMKELTEALDRET